MPLGVAEIHRVKIEREQRGLFTALSRPDFHDDVLLVEWVARHELRAKASGELAGLRSELPHFLEREVAHLRIVAFGKVLGLREPPLGIAKRADRLGRRGGMPCRRRPGTTGKRMSWDRSWAAPRRSASYEIDATGMTSNRRTTRSTSRLTRGRKAKIAIDTTTTRRRNAVPQRGCAVGYGSMRSGVSGSPCSKAWIVMCSAPWYANTRRTSGRNEIATRYPTSSARRMRPSVTFRTIELGIIARARLVARYGTPMKRRRAPPSAA